MNVILKTQHELDTYICNLKNTYKGLQIHQNVIVDFVRLKSNRRKEKTCAFIILKNLICNTISIKRFDNYRKICKSTLNKKNTSLYVNSKHMKSRTEFSNFWKNKTFAGVRVIDTKINTKYSVDENFEYVTTLNNNNRWILVECMKTLERRWISEYSVKSIEYQCELNPNFILNVKNVRTISTNSSTHNKFK
jgi:hypothetical protein